MARVSVIVPVYKADEFLPECLASIESQDYGDFELIVEDDSQGSGVSAARNRGLDRASGEFVTFVDADDYLSRGAISALVAASDGVDFVAGSFRKFGLFEMTVTHDFQEFNMPELAAYAMDNLLNPRDHQMLSGCWAKLYRRKMIGMFPLLTTAEDMAFNFDYLSRCRLARFIPDIVYHNRKRKGSLTQSFDKANRKGLFNVLEALDYVEKFLAWKVRPEQIRRALDNSKMYHSMLYFMRICQATGKPMDEVFKEIYP